MTFNFKKYLACTVGVAAVAGALLSAYLAFHVKPFTVNDYFFGVVQYSSPTTVDGVNAFGPGPEECGGEKGMANAVTQANDPQIEPPGENSIVTCLHVNFGGPLSANGVVVVQPWHDTQKPLEYALIAFLYDKAGKFVGDEALHACPDVATCTTQAHEVIGENAKKVNGSKSLLIYVLPLPVLPSSKSAAPDGSQTL